jgi:peptidoglycan/xylan/chitin deacetylase (PgdA/CDA1 family)
VAAALPENPPPELLAFAEPDPELAQPRCLGPEPRGRWAGRRSDDDWARGLYPRGDRYPENWLTLTFDDGPHSSRTTVVLDELARHGQHATFFLTGHAIRKGTYPLVQRMLAEGHTLANHGFRHDIRMAEMIDSPKQVEAYVASELELTQIRVDIALLATSPEDFSEMEARVFRKLNWLDERAEQLSAMPKLRERHRALLEERGYSDNERPYRLEWVRPPGGNPYLGHSTSQERSTFARVVNRMGLSVVMWTHGTGDSDPRLEPKIRMDPERVAGTALEAIERGGIYVAHDRIDPEALVAMLETIAASDAVIVSLAQLRDAKLEALGYCD